MKKIIVGAILALGLTTCANADNLADIHINTLGYYVKGDKGATCHKIENAFSYKDHLLKKFGNVKLNVNDKYLSSFITYQNDTRYAYTFGNNLNDCENYRRNMNEVYADNGWDQLYTDILIVKKVPTVSTINMESLGYKLKIDYGEVCTKIDNAEKFKQKILKKYGDLELSSNDSYGSSLDVRTKTGKLISYSFSSTIHGCRNFQKAMNKNEANKGRSPIFPDIK